MNPPRRHIHLGPSTAYHPKCTCEPFSQTVLIDTERMNNTTLNKSFQHGQPALMAPIRVLTPPLQHTRRQYPTRISHVVCNQWQPITCEELLESRFQFLPWDQHTSARTTQQHAWEKEEELPISFLLDNIAADRTPFPPERPQKKKELSSSCERGPRKIDSRLQSPKSWMANIHCASLHSKCCCKKPPPAFQLNQFRKVAGDLHPSDTKKLRKPVQTVTRRRTQHMWWPTCASTGAPKLWRTRASGQFGQLPRSISLLS